MPGILDEVIDGIAAKEKQTPPATPPQSAAPPAQTPPEGGQAAPPAQTPPAPAAPDGKGLYEYSDEFKEKYGGRK
jgi:hypothetical protein